MSKRTIKVTQEYIDNAVMFWSDGEGNWCLNCAVARAVSEELGYPVETCSQQLYAKGATVSLPGHVTRWIEQFDDRQLGEPFEFQINESPFLKAAG